MKTTFQSEFCEKEYEIMVDSEAIYKYGLYIFIPSQNQERSRGFDAVFGNNKTKKVIALQYKITTKIKNPNKSIFHGDTYKISYHRGKTPYYKTNNSKRFCYQHNLLVKWNKTFPAGYFVAKENTRSFLNKNQFSIIEESLFITPNQAIAPNDFMPHHCVFDFNGNIGQYSHSFSENIKYTNLINALNKSEGITCERLKKIICFGEKSDNLYKILRQNVCVKDIPYSVFINFHNEFIKVHKCLYYTK